MSGLLMTIPSHAAAGGPRGPAPAASDVRLAPLAESLAHRLRGACREWDAAEFEALVERIARTKLRWLDAGYGE